MLGMPLSTLSTYVGAMLARGDARRIPNPTDGRSVRLVLTDRGRGVVRTVNPAFTAALVALEAGLERPVDEVRAVLLEIQDAIDRADARPQGDRYFELVVSCGHVAQPTSPRSSRAAPAPAGGDARRRCLRERGPGEQPDRTRSIARSRLEPERRLARRHRGGDVGGADGIRGQDRRPWLPGRAAQGDPSRPVPRRGRGGLHGAGRQDRGRGTVVDRRRIPRCGHGPDGSPRARRSLGSVGDGPVRTSAHRLACLAVGLPRRVACRRRARPVCGPRRGAGHDGRTPGRRGRPAGGRAARPARQQLVAAGQPAHLPAAPERPARARRPRLRRSGSDPRAAERLRPRRHARTDADRGVA